MIIFSSVGDIMLTFLIIIALVIVTGFLIMRIIREMQKNKEERSLLIEGVISKSEMNSVIAVYMNKLKENAKFSLIYLDLDKFEDFVMAFGKKESVTILKGVAQKIKEILPKNAYLSNYQKDDFLIFLPGQYNKAEVSGYAKQLLESFQEQTKVLEDYLIDLTASIAVVYYPQHGENIKTLLESLHLAIYKLKKAGGNNIKVYSSDLTSDEQYLEYYNQVKDAIHNKEFQFYYQPIYDLKTNKIVMYEALIRWNHPEHGLIAPFKFIDILEQSGDIHWIGTWGLNELIKMHLKFKDLDAKNIPLISMNLSPKQLMNKEIVKEYAKILRKQNVTASNFVLEIGEFALFDRQEVFLENFKKLKKIGFKIAIDDFGIDLATFEKLKELDVDIIKVDYESLAEETFAVNKYMEILQAFATDKRMIIAEKIEKEEDEKRIKGFNIRYTQGYFYSKPISEKIIFEPNNKSVDKENI